MRVFGDTTSNIPVTLRFGAAQADTTPLTFRLGIRLLQSSSATAAPFAESPWKTLLILPGQTVLESAPVCFPAVRGETPFFVQWRAGSREVIGTSEVLVYPTNLLEELRPLAGDQPLGLFDPLDQLKPLVNAVRVEFLDLETTGLDWFRGRLAIVGPFSSDSQMPQSLCKQVQVVAKAGVGVVWIQPPEPIEPIGVSRRLVPSFYSLAEGRGQIVVAQAHLVDALSEKPQSQLNLVALARLAVRPELPSLPHPIQP